MTKQHQEIVKYLVSQGFQATDSGVFVKIINGRPFLVEHLNEGEYFCDTVGYNNYYFTLDQIKEFIEFIESI